MWEERHPLGACGPPELQTSNCTCVLAMDTSVMSNMLETCTEWTGTHTASTCRSGCGDVRHGHLDVDGTRLRYAEPLSPSCIMQLQAMGRACRGDFGSDALGTIRQSSWCVLGEQGNSCSDVHSPFLYPGCLTLDVSHPPPVAPGNPPWLLDMQTLSPSVSAPTLPGGPSVAFPSPLAPVPFEPGSSPPPPLGGDESTNDSSAPRVAVRPTGSFPVREDALEGGMAAFRSDVLFSVVITTCLLSIVFMSIVLITRHRVRSQRT